MIENIKALVFANATKIYFFPVHLEIASMIVSRDITGPSPCIPPQPREDVTIAGTGTAESQCYQDIKMLNSGPSPSASAP